MKSLKTFFGLIALLCIIQFAMFWCYGSYWDFPGFAVLRFFGVRLTGLYYWAFLAVNTLFCGVVVATVLGLLVGLVSDFRYEYDVFLSYRRDPGRDLAGRIAEKLKNRGYSVSFDLESEMDNYREELPYRVSHSRNLVFLMTEDVFKDCEDEEDWVRKELEEALSHRINIVPVEPTEVMVKRKSQDEGPFPDVMPGDLQWLKDLDVTEIGQDKTFAKTMEALEHRLKKVESTREKAFRRFVLALVNAFALAADAFRIRGLNAALDLHGDHARVARSRELEAFCAVGEVAMRNREYAIAVSYFNRVKANWKLLKVE